MISNALEWTETPTFDAHGLTLPLNDVNFTG